MGPFTVSVLVTVKGCMALIFQLFQCANVRDALLKQISSLLLFGHMLLYKKKTKHIN